MSKSVGNVTDSQEIIDKYGAEILRLWVAAEDYTDDIRISDEILKRLVEAYRRIRNTSRYILGNLYDFDSAKDMVPYEKMTEIDRWALHRLQEIIQRVREAYENYQFHVVYYTLYNYCTVDLSALYLDVMKDRLYTSKNRSAARRSAQTAMYTILETMARLLAPMLTFTSEEIWLALPGSGEKAASIHLTQFPDVNPLFLNPELGEKWKTIIAVRSEISKAIEAARKNKVVGHSLDAAVTVVLPEKLRLLLAPQQEDLRAFLIVSQFAIADKIDTADAYASTEIEGLVVGVGKAKGEKCNRCWIYNETLGSDAAHPCICDRCLANIK
jgi:isoleucyl-tRNA synthetase